MNSTEQLRATKDHDRDHDRHLRRKCEHCNEMLSHTAYLSHKIRYYNESTKKWLKERYLDTEDQYIEEGDDTNPPLPSSLPISMDTTEANDASAYDQSAVECFQHHTDDNEGQRN